MEGACSPPVDGATASRRLKRGSWLPGITKRSGVTSEGGGGIWERQQELLGGGVGLRGRLSRRSCRSKWKSTSNLVQLNSSFIRSEGVPAKIQGVLLEEIKIISLIRVGCMGLLLPWVPCRRGLRACRTGPAATPPSTQGAGG